MNRTRRKATAIILCLTLILSGMTTVFAASEEMIKVQYNGKDIAFSGVCPKLTEGSAMVPFRQTLEAMGAKVAYDKGTQAISAKIGNREISGTLGSTTLLVSENGVTDKVELPVAPHLDGNQSSIYIPARAIEAGFGYALGWDRWEKTIVIVDIETVFSAAQKDFSILGKLMKNEMDWEKAYEIKGKMDTQSTMLLDSLPLTMETSVMLEGIHQQGKIEMTMTYQMNNERYLQSIEDPELRTAMQEMYGMINQTKVTTKMDVESGDLWMHTDFTSPRVAGTDQNVWYKMNIYDRYDDMGIDIRPIMMASVKGELLQGELLKQMFSAMEINDVEFYSTMNASYTFLNYLVGDKAFTKESRGGEDIYTLKIDEKAILAAMMKTAAELKVPVGDLGTEMEDILGLIDFSGELTVRTKGEALTNYTMKGSYNGEDTSFTLELSGNPWESKVNLSMNVEDLLKLVYNIDMQTKETNKTPNMIIPADAQIYDPNDLNDSTFFYPEG